MACISLIELPNLQLISYLLNWVRVDMLFEINWLAQRLIYITICRSKFYNNRLRITYACTYLLSITVHTSLVSDDDSLPIILCFPMFLNNSLRWMRIYYIWPKNIIRDRRASMYLTHHVVKHIQTYELSCCIIHFKQFSRCRPVKLKHWLDAGHRSSGERLYNDFIWFGTAHHVSFQNGTPIYDCFERRRV